MSSFRLLPWASVCFRGRVVAAVSLACEFYPLYDIGNLGDVILENGAPKGFKNTLKRGYQGGS